MGVGSFQRNHPQQESCQSVRALGWPGNTQVVTPQFCVDRLTLGEAHTLWDWVLPAGESYGVG